MYPLINPADTIAAISTAAGPGGIGIVRMSGPQALGIADQIFLSSNKSIKPSQFKSYTVHYGWVVDRTRGRGQEKRDEGIIDEALLTVMRAPKSYTREDIVEISCHGGFVVLKTILNRAVELGARLAEPGEFTKRAFLNGRMDLTQAEAVLDIIQSRTDAFLRVSTHQLKGELTIILEEIREKLMHAYVECEAIVNFPEDEVDSVGKEKILKVIQEAQKQVHDLLASSKQGKILKDGIRLVICGKANVGKSTLLNVLLQQPRAIVSDVAGTTRDTIEETLQIKGIPFQIVDTAGILAPRDQIEEEAVRRSHTHIRGADLILFMLDAGQGIAQEDESIIHKIKAQSVLVIINKCDLDNTINETHMEGLLPKRTIVRISAFKKTGIDTLQEAIAAHVLEGKAIDTQGVLISNLRHIHALKSCAEAMAKGAESLEKGLSLEFISEEIKSAVNGLDAITGRNIHHDLLEQIFSQFCIGK